MCLKKLFTIFASTILGISTAHATSAPMTLDEGQIRSSVYSFSSLADQGAYQHLGRLFAEQVVVDYTSLWGGEPATTSSRELMQQWKAFLPGFDATLHELSNLKVEVKGDKATATVNVTARHWLSTQAPSEQGYWSITGSYQFDFIKQDKHWLIEAVKLNFESESGSREVLGQAPDFAEQNQQARDDLLLSL